MIEITLEALAVGTEPVVNSDLEYEIPMGVMINGKRVLLYYALDQAESFAYKILECIEKARDYDEIDSSDETEGLYRLDELD